MNWPELLIGANDVLSVGVGATAFALQLYLFFYNRDSRVARSFSGLLACVVFVYLTDLLMGDAQNPRLTESLLRWQWLGIAFTPTLYLEFTRAIRQVVQQDHFPHWLRIGSYVLSAVIAALAVTTDLVVHNGVKQEGAAFLHPGPLFYPFALLFALALFWGLRQTLAARRRCYTHAARRRMTYLSIGFIAPALGVFPYLLIMGWPVALPGILLWALLLLGNVAVGVMLALMAYAVAFIGALTPDRVIKHRLVRFLLRGPFAALVALIAFGVGRTVERTLGLGQYTLSLLAVAAAVILVQLGVELAKPLLDLALYREGRAEVVRAQELSQSLLTTADLRQFLENILAALCELVQSDAGFIAALEDGVLQRDIWCGFNITADDIAGFPLAESAAAKSQDGLILWNDYWIAPLYDRANVELLGLMGICRPQSLLPLPAERRELFERLLQQAQVALEDRRLQQVAFATLTPILGELGEIQRRQGLLRYNGASAESFELTASEELPQWVHDALAHYWGGPRLTENPLLSLQVVQRAAASHDGSPIKGLRAVLSEALEQLRPDGERKLTAPEWLLYNILEMKFIRGEKVREVAMRLALSESDYYRKQRIAIESLTHIIVDMETRLREDTAAGK
ncbi:MAG TPA: histidine kinase N-terminal 7TM domain-containing protein [Anaerolineae bacterium]|nr:histidine kinase N-terminal 7TM domain-containing protein [Anaerolineae bacterium]